MLPYMPPPQNRIPNYATVNSCNMLDEKQSGTQWRRQERVRAGNCLPENPLACLLACPDIFIYEN